MSLEWAIMNFGYPALVVGTFFEGEVILILGGFAAHRGYLHLPLVILAAFTGSLLGDQFYFFLARRRGQAVMAKHPEWDDRIARFRRLMDRHGTIIILAFRFLYGLRTVGPFVIGLSRISAVKFIILNIVSAAVWAVTLGVLGYLFGHTMELILNKIKSYELIVMAGLLFLGAALFFIKRYRDRKKRNRLILKKNSR